MTLLQLLAARLAGLDRVRFYVSDEAGRAAFDAGAADLVGVLAAAAEDGRDVPLEALLARIDDLDYEWGVSNGT